MKIDCNITQNYMKEQQRMCGFYKNCYEGCPATYICNFEKRRDEDMVSIVQVWSDEHPRLTYLEDLMEKYPNVAICEDGTPEFCPNMLGFCNEKSCAPLRCPECWNQTV